MFEQDIRLQKGKTMEQKGGVGMRNIFIISDTHFWPRQYIKVHRQHHWGQSQT